jgi:hypothetical protein
MTTTITVQGFDRYSGHMIGQAHRTLARFPSRGDAVADAMDELRSRFGARLSGRPWVFED